jgi:transposase
MCGTMTFVGMDVHARSTSAAAIDVMSGELLRMRFGAGVEAPVAWLLELPGPVRACYEAGPTGFGLYRAAVAAGIQARWSRRARPREDQPIGSRPIVRTRSCSPGVCWPGLCIRSWFRRFRSRRPGN